MKTITRLLILISMLIIVIFIILLSNEFAKELDLSSAFKLALGFSFIILHVFIQDLVIQRFISDDKKAGNK